MRLCANRFRHGSASRYRVDIRQLQIVTILCLSVLLSAASMSAQPVRQTIVPVASQMRTYWGDGPSDLTIGLNCAAQATARFPKPVEFFVLNYTITDYTGRAWLGHRDEASLQGFQFEWESDDSDGYRAHHGSISYASHREAFIGTRANREGAQEEYVRTVVTIPPVVNGKSPIEVAKDAASKGVPMKWTISHPGDKVIFYVVVDWNSIIGACGRTDFVGGAPESLSQAQISNARFHIQQASEALGAERE